MTRLSPAEGPSPPNPLHQKSKTPSTARCDSTPDDEGRIRPGSTSDASQSDSMAQDTSRLTPPPHSSQQDSHVVQISQPKLDQAVPPRSRFFELPRELRDIIYVHAVGTTTRVRLRDKNTKTKRLDLIRGVHSMQPEYPLGRNIRAPLKAIKWHRCLMGLFLASKDIWIEVRDILYNNITFHFESPSQTQAYLREVPRADLERIRSIVIEYHDLASFLHDGAKNQAHEADVREMWEKVIECLPNVQHLKIDMGDMGYDGIVPDYGSHPYELWERFDVDRFNMPWVRDLMNQIFRELGNLETAQVVFREYNNHNMRAMWNYYGHEIPLPLPPNTSKRFAKATVNARWAEWYKALQKSFGEAISKLILNEDNPWDDHLDLLEWYYDWRWDPYDITGLYQTKKGKGHKIKFCGKWVWV